MTLRELAEKVADEIDDNFLKVHPGDRWDMMVDKIFAGFTEYENERYKDVRTLL